MRSRIFLILLLMFLAACAPSAQTSFGSPALELFSVEPVPSAERWIIAVPNFNVRAGGVVISGQDFERQTEGFYKELGAGVADIFVNEAFRSQQFRITERAELDKVLLEQNLAASGRVDPATAADLGRITGAELLILGSLSEFGVSKTGGGGQILGVLGSSSETVTARVTVDIRVVDAVTAEILAIGSATSEVSQSNVQVDIANVMRALQAGRSGTTIIDIAVRNAIIGAINDAAASLPAKPSK